MLVVKELAWHRRRPLDVEAARGPAETIVPAVAGDPSPQLIVAVKSPVLDVVVFASVKLPTTVVLGRTTPESYRT